MAKYTQTNRATLATIAKACDVSNATVSRVLRGDNTNGFSVRSEVRERIMQTVVQMNYRPDLAAQSLRSQQTHIVAVLGLNHQWRGLSDVNSTAVGAAVGVLHQMGYSVCTSFPKPDQLGGQLPPWRVDGYLIVGVQNKRSLKEIEASSIPYVSINTRVGENGYACQVDDALGICKVLDYLQQMGHIRIAYRNGSADRSRPDSHAVEDRHTAFVHQIQARQLPLLGNHDTMVLSDEDFLVQTMEQQATVVVAYDLTEAMRLMQMASQLKIAIPDDLSLICFNDEYPAAILTTPLTVMGVPAQSMGRQAAVMLVDLLQSKKPSQQVQLFEEQLVIRQSVLQNMSR